MLRVHNLDNNLARGVVKRADFGIFGDFMRQAKWIAETNDPYSMLNFLGQLVSNRKARLFACACFRRKTPKLKKWELRILQIAERYADGLTSEEELQQAQEESLGRSGVAWLTMTDDCWTAVEAARAAGEWKDEAIQCALVRDVFGNPFRRNIVDRALLAWNDGAIPKLAQAIYDDRAFERLPILADALEEAGCTNADILNHCRQPGEHVRGCWVVDLLLGKS
jgi:hypothetical protein